MFYGQNGTKKDFLKNGKICILKTFFSVLPPEHKMLLATSVLIFKLEEGGNYGCDSEIFTCIEFTNILFHR